MIRLTPENYIDEEGDSLAVRNWRKQQIALEKEINQKISAGKEEALLRDWKKSIAEGQEIASRKKWCAVLESIDLKDIKPRKTTPIVL